MLVSVSKAQFSRFFSVWGSLRIYEAIHSIHLKLLSAFWFVIKENQSLNNSLFAVKTMEQGSCAVVHLDYVTTMTPTYRLSYIPISITSLMQMACKQYASSRTEHNLGVNPHSSWAKLFCVKHPLYKYELRPDILSWRQCIVLNSAIILKSLTSSRQLYRRPRTL